MKFRDLTLLFLVAVCATEISAQERDAQVLRWGELRLSGAAEFLHADGRYGSRDRQSLGADFALALSPENFLPLAPISSAVSAFLDATAAVGDPAFEAPALSAGDLSLEVASTSRVVPFGLSLGILPRVEIGAILPVFRSGRRATRVGLTGGLFGLNPDPTGNGTLLTGIDESGVVLGSAALLPVAGSPLGEELRSRVLVLTGEELQLPETALTGAEFLAAFPGEPFSEQLGEWGLGDLELQARVQLLHSFAGRYFPASNGLNYRLALEGGLRLPTGESADTAFALAIGPEIGWSGYWAGAVLDFFYGDRVWLTANTSWSQRSTRDRVVWYPVLVQPPILGGQPVALRRQPGPHLEIGLLPRVRLTREFSAGALLIHERIGGDDFSIPEGVTGSAFDASRTSIGFSLRYSTLPAREAGNSILAIEFATGYMAAVAGSGGAPSIGRAFLQVSILPRIWGGAAAEEVTPESGAP